MQLISETFDISTVSCWRCLIKDSHFIWPNDWILSRCSLMTEAAFQKATCASSGLTWHPRDHDEESAQVQPREDEWWMMNDGRWTVNDSMLQLLMTQRPAREIFLSSSQVWALTGLPLKVLWQVKTVTRRWKPLKNNKRRVQVSYY